MLKKVPKAKNYPEMGSKFLDMYILVDFKERKKIWDGTQKSRWVDVESPYSDTCYKGKQDKRVPVVGE